MKKILVLLMICGMFLVGSCSPEDENGEPDPDEVVTFTDYKLKQCVRDELRTEETDLLYKDVSRIMFLDCTGYGIESLSGMENLPILKGAELGNNKIKDVTPLGKCVNLRELELFENEIEDASPLGNLVNLTRLNISNNSISDINYVVNLLSLNTFYTGGNPISNISAVSDLTNLTGLSFSFAKVKDISPVKNLINLTGLYMNDNEIVSLSDIKGLINLIGIGVGDNCITDFSPIDYLKENGKLVNILGDSSDNQDYSRCE